ncbi:4'-phosphopantetheinyl transferase superfamily protein [Streptomyces sp. NBC_00513]|uniref:4'-phosphopantetheinyl transferase family protein n=1 Tax=unclassified Streptomyces TaxID=2593676 RepID=UPI00224FDD03|nr:4'-phosphopantetheinyl transferase superfamily protein [Streptomyces sp. NBC_00424]MCX5071079.1 4'-phosphopantetheinyl transferase superfamily protein [Streptomyces sp. NBC_00424]WUD45496.1 4'-phosphopantetheinyl transferase superfamily protein [Streptomyces sp. NBC_00513]
MQPSPEFTGPPPGWTSSAWPTARPRPAEGSADLWLLRVPAAGLPTADLDRSALDAGERARAAGFAHSLDRDRYTAAHLALRRVLSAYRGVPPAELRFLREPCPCCDAPHGRPALAGPDAPHFSLSHTGDLVLIAVAGRPVGVDVEGVPAPHRAATVGEALHPAERSQIRGAPPSSRPAVFARLWARKEAYLKGLGTGLGRGPDLDYLGDPAPGAPARPPGWTVQDLPAGPHHAAALALAQPRTTAPALTLHTHFLGARAGNAESGSAAIFPPPLP